MRILSTSFAVILLAAAALPAHADVATVSGEPLQKADPATVSAAMGHFGRARSLLNAALREFDLGLKIVNPDALLDVGAWRSSVLERATELERVLDPQPRASKGGVRYEPDTRLLQDPVK